jgi:hypothetical protein
VGRKRTLDAAALGYDASGPSWPEHFQKLLDEQDRRINALLAEKDKRDQQRYDAQTEAVKTAMTASQTAMKAAMDAAERAGEKAMAASDKAMSTARVADDKRFELLNELRVGVATREQVEALEKVVNALKEELFGFRQRGAGVNASWAMMFGLGGLILTLIGVVVAVIVASN